jgi:flagellar FliJ protein
MAFKFRLEKALDYRKQLEEQAMLALARARAARDAEKERLEDLKAELIRARAEMNAAAGMDGAERWLTRVYIHALQLDAESAGQRLRELDEEVAVCQNELTNRSQNREILDKLKSRQAKRFAEEEKFREQRENDETATIRYKKAVI